MGYPLGTGLRREILENLQKYEDLIAPLGISRGDIQRFINEFSKSQMASIDAFLARRADFSAIGKIAIAISLLSKEHPSALINNHHEDNWYFYLFNKIAAVAWESLDLSDLSIITFNYDRSLEQYLISAIYSSYGRTPDEAIEKLSAMKIIHIYGCIGENNPGKIDYFPYEDTISSKKILRATRDLRVIPEGRNEDQSLLAAKSILLEADAIGFMGFSYDPINLQRLNSTSTCIASVVRSNGRIIRNISGTALGMTTAEIHKAATVIGNNGVSTIVKQNWFRKTNCLDYLRETLILDIAFK